MKIAVASDHAGYEVKEALASHLRAHGHDIEDYGCFDDSSCDYPDFAVAAARGVASGAQAFGVLVCGTGLGVCMAANKIAGIRAAPVHDRMTAEMSRRHNNANVVCIGARVTEKDAALDLVDLWLETRFEGGRHGRRVGKIDSLDGADCRQQA